jgi:4-hydroxy-tetrahydrodipicolinate synthase
MKNTFSKDTLDQNSANQNQLNDNIKSGGAGCISATANINPGKIAETYRKYATPEGEKLQAWINEVRGVMQGYVMIPALKYVIAHYGDDSHWTPVRPPLVETEAKVGKDMIEKLDRLGFTMPGLKQAMAVAAE